MEKESGQIEISATSKNGDINEALLQAFEKAKDELKTDFVRWELQALTGEYGGFTIQHHVSVTIKASGPA